MLSILLAVVAMACRDALSTFLTIAEARGRSVLAGALDAAGDLAGIGVTVVGAGTVITDGVTWHSVLIVAVMVVTSFAGTIAWTRIGQRIGATPK